MANQRGNNRTQPYDVDEQNELADPVSGATLASNTDYSGRAGIENVDWL